MRSLTKRLVAILLAFVTVCSLLCVTTCAKENDENSDKKTSQESEQVSIQTYKIETEDAETTQTSAGFLNLFNKRLSLRDTDCEHDFDEIVVNPTCKRVGYTVFYCCVCEYSYMDEFVLPSSHEFAEFEATYNDKAELHRICTVCEYEEIAEEKKHSRYFTGNEITEKVWTSYKATLEQREERAKALAKMGIVLKGDKIVNDVPGYVWDFLMEKIGNPYGVAGIMGNLYAESGMRTINLQNTYEHSLGYTDQGYTDAVDSGAYSYDSFRTDEAGYGLAQWTSGGRKANLYKYAQNTNRSIGDLDMQLEFLWQELISGYPRLVSTLQNASTIREASTAFLTQFERPADQGAGVQTARAGFGENYFIAYSR